jgi:hypothetical protein
MTALQPDTLIFGMQFVAGTPKNAGCLFILPCRRCCLKSCAGVIS